MEGFFWELGNLYYAILEDQDFQREWWVFQLFETGGEHHTAQKC